MVFIQPKKGVADEEIADFPTAIVEDEGAPIGMLAAARIGMLIQMRTVEVAQTMPITRKMGRHPIEEDTNAALMQGVNQIHQILRRAKTASRSVVTDCLITPGSIERMFSQR